MIHKLISILLISHFLFDYLFIYDDATIVKHFLHRRREYAIV